MPTPNKCSDKPSTAYPRIHFRQCLHPLQVLTRRAPSARRQKAADLAFPSPRDLCDRCEECAPSSPRQSKHVQSEDWELSENFLHFLRDFVGTCFAVCSSPCDFQMTAVRRRASRSSDDASWHRVLTQRTVPR